MSNQLKDYIHLYLGCKIENPYDATKNIIGTLVGVAKNMLFIQNKDIFGRHWDELTAVNVDKCKLILRPLSSLTELEAIEFVKIREWHGYGDHPHNREYCTYRNSWGQLVVKCGDHRRTFNVPETKTAFDPDEFHWLLYKGFDLFNLLKEGLAIDSTIINKTEQ